MTGDTYLRKKMIWHFLNYMQARDTCQKKDNVTAYFNHSVEDILI